MNNKKNIEKSLRWDCRYYNGEKLNPYEEELKKHRVDNRHLPPPACMHDEYDIPSDEVEKLQVASTCFDYERGWVNRRLKNDYEFHVDEEYLMDIGADFEKADATPIDLKSIIYNRYVHWCLGDYVDDKGIQGFKKWYRERYACRPTWRQVRQNERGKKLLDKCLYYKGEKDNPWEYCYTDLLRKRKIYWYIERSWYNLLVFSYKNALSTKIKEMHLLEYFNAQNCPVSLIECVISYDMIIAKRDGKKYGAVEMLQSFESYKECVPLGDGPERYFSFFKGEAENPYKHNLEGHNNLLWMQESIVYGNLQTHPSFLKGFELCDKKLDESNAEYYGVDVWMFDTKYPAEQRSIWEFVATNYLTWVPMGGNELDEICEKFIGFRYDKNKSFDEQCIPIDVPTPILERMVKEGFDAAERWWPDDEIWALGWKDENGRLSTLGAPELYLVKDEMTIDVTLPWFNLQQSKYAIDELKAQKEKSHNYKIFPKVEIPDYIQNELDDYGFNSAEKFELNGVTYWSLASVDENGEPLPTGRPIIYEDKDGYIRQLLDEEVHYVLSNI